MTRSRCELQLLVAVGFEQQREQAVELFLQFGLIRGGGREALVFQQLDDRFEPHVDILLAALGDRLAQQLGPARVGRGRKLGQPADDFFQPLEAIGKPGLIDGEFIGGGGCGLSAALSVWRARRFAAGAATRDRLATALANATAHTMRIRRRAQVISQTCECAECDLLDCRNLTFCPFFAPSRLCVRSYSLRSLILKQALAACLFVVLWCGG